MIQVSFKPHTTTKRFSSPADVDKQWISQQIQQRHDENNVRVRLKIKTDRIRLGLSCPATKGGGGPPPNGHERPIIELWNKVCMNGDGINPGQLISFFSRLKNHL